MVSRTDYNTMDVSELLAVSEYYSPRYRLEPIGELCILYCGTLERANLPKDPGGPGWKKACWEVKGSVPGKLGYFLRFRGNLTSNVRR